MSGPSACIVCSACGAETLVKRIPLYDGFKKTGEALQCATCGHVYAQEADVPYVRKAGPKVFDPAEVPKPVVVFSENEKGRVCRHCGHYVVNPFVQRCTLRRAEVEATDTCPAFERRPESEPEA